MQRLMSSRQNQNSYSTLLVELNSFLNPMYVEAWVPFLLVPTLVLYKAPTLAYIVQYLLAKLGGNLEMCQWKERQSNFNTDVVCATPCSV